MATSNQNADEGLSSVIQPSIQLINGQGSSSQNLAYPQSLRLNGSAEAISPTPIYQTLSPEQRNKNFCFRQMM
jgi:hypothetical protein